MEYHFFVFHGTLGFPLFNRQRRHHGCAGEAEWSMDATFRRLPEKNILTGNSSDPERQRRYARVAGLLIGNIVRYIIACNVITNHSGRLGAPP